MTKHLHYLRFLAAPTAFCCAGILSSCGATSAPTVQRVDVPLPVPCVRAEDLPTRPSYEFNQLPADAGDGVKVLALAADWARGRNYEGLLQATIAGCL